MPEGALSKEEEREVDAAVTSALLAGQGEYTAADFLTARTAIVDALLAGDVAEMVLEGTIGIVVEGGQAKYVGRKSSDN
jgi:hypothetical protein